MHCCYIPLCLYLPSFSEWKGSFERSRQTAQHGDHRIDCISEAYKPKSDAKLSLRFEELVVRNALVRLNDGVADCTDTMSSFDQWRRRGHLLDSTHRHVHLDPVSRTSTVLHSIATLLHTQLVQCKTRQPALISNLRKIGQKLRSLSRAIGTSDGQTHTSSDLYSVQCPGFALSKKQWGPSPPFPPFSFPFPFPTPRQKFSVTSVGVIFNQWG